MRSTPIHTWPMPAHLPLSAPTLAVMALVRQRAPRVQCLTNTVAQQITANVLLAAGARASMATHPDEVVAMSAGADALLINLGTLDQARIDAIPRLLVDAHVCAKPRVLDPVFVEHSPLRRDLANRIAAAGPLIVKGNSAELAALTLPAYVTRVETGRTDRIADRSGRTEFSGGHPWMAQVTGLGCALGGLIAACAAVEPSPRTAATAALEVFARAGEHAALDARGPASFAMSFVDTLALC